MDTKLLQYYERELQYLREMGGEFARAFPKIAGRLGLENYACADPYVERLLEGFSFLAARIQLKIDAEFPRFTNHLLELVYPQYLAPTPSMAVVQMEADLSEAGLASGFVIERGTVMHSLLGSGDQTSCEFRTAHALTLWPIELQEAQYFAYSGEVGGVNLQGLGPVKAGLRMRLKATAGLHFNQISLQRLAVYLRGSDVVPGRLLEQCLGQSLGMVLMPVAPMGQSVPWHQVLSKSEIRPLGFGNEHALLPASARGFHGYRLLQEYFALPQRFMFLELGGLQAGLRRCDEQEIDIVLLFKQHDPILEATVNVDNFALFCTPAINLFPKRADRVHLSEQETDYQIVPDRSRPMDFEVYQVATVTAYGSGAEPVQTFSPFYTANDLMDAAETAHAQTGYFQIRRTRRLLSERQRLRGPRSSYVGSETFLSLVDSAAAPFSSELRQLGVETLCTNRDLVLSMPVGIGRTDFTVESGAPILASRCVCGPTVPAPSHAEGETAWRLINHLSLNYLSLLDEPGKPGATTLRDLLSLYCRAGDTVALAQIDGIRSVTAQPIVRRLPIPGPLCHGRGLQITVTINEAGFEGTGSFLLGSVLEHFFARYASINTFTETVLRSEQRGEIMKWPVREGLCATL